LFHELLFIADRFVRTGVELQTYVDKAFHGCHLLTDLCIPASVTGDMLLVFFGLEFIGCGVIRI
jgi:hypothetical protein